MKEEFDIETVEQILHKAKEASNAYQRLIEKSGLNKNAIKALLEGDHMPSALLSEAKQKLGIINSIIRQQYHKKQKPTSARRISKV